jgi:hypothetical protein
MWLGKSRYIKDELFYQLLKLHGVELSLEARNVINATFKKGDKINYTDAMPVICIDLETAATL